jgi:hypothetical protein
MGGFFNDAFLLGEDHLGLTGSLFGKVIFIPVEVCFGLVLDLHVNVCFALGELVLDVA